LMKATAGSTVNFKFVHLEKHVITKSDSISTVKTSFEVQFLTNKKLHMIMPHIWGIMCLQKFNRFKITNHNRLIITMVLKKIGALIMPHKLLDQMNSFDKIWISKLNNGTTMLIKKTIEVGEKWMNWKYF
jgi:hypothetical protein